MDTELAKMKARAGAAVISENFFKLKDGINADAFIIGRTYNISGITK